MSEENGLTSTLTSLVVRPVNGVIERIDVAFQGAEPWKIFVTACGVTVITIRVYDQLRPFDDPVHRLKKYFGKLAMKIPQVRRRIEDELNAAGNNLEKTFHDNVKGVPYTTILPANGLPPGEVLKLVDDHVNLATISWRKGRASGAVYFGDDELYKLQVDAFLKTIVFNPLHPEIFPAVRKMEAEVIRWSCNLFNGGPSSVGVVTCGGTESIFLACLAYRNWAIEEKGIKVPEMVVADSAHAAFEKSAMILQMKCRKVPCDPLTFRADPKLIARAINSRTCMLVASAPSFPHGVMDPVEEIAALGVKYGIPVHVDGCLGGFLIAFMDEAGFPLPPFDFRVPGVTSMSADTHKYGYAMKGTSVIMYREPKWRGYHCSSFAITDWPGGLYVTTTIAGSRPGGLIGACWAGMLSIGKKGYVERTRKIIETARYIQGELLKIPGLLTFAPDVSVISMRSDDFDIYAVLDGLSHRGWCLNPLQFPSAIHFCITLMQTEPGVADAFIKDCTEVVREVSANPSQKTGSARVYGTSQEIPIRDVIGESLLMYVDKYFSTNPNALPAR